MESVVDKQNNNSPEPPQTDTISLLSTIAALTKRLSPTHAYAICILLAIVLVVKAISYLRPVDVQCEDVTIDNSAQAIVGDGNQQAQVNCSRSAPIGSKAQP